MEVAAWARSLPPRLLEMKDGSRQLSSSSLVELISGISILDEAPKLERQRWAVEVIHGR